jgi:hypothetical protein
MIVPTKPVDLERTIELSPYRPLTPEGEWQTLWFDVLRTPWRTLLVVPSEPRLSALFVARALAEVGKTHGESTVHLIDGEDCTFSAARSFVDTMRSLSTAGDRALLAVDCPLVNRAAIPIARAADAVLLVVPLAEGSLSGANRCINLVGREHIIGCVALGAIPRRR